MSFFEGLFVQVSSLEHKLGSLVQPDPLDFCRSSLADVRGPADLRSHGLPVFGFLLRVPSLQLAFVRLVTQRLGQAGLQVEPFARRARSSSVVGDVVEDLVGRSGCLGLEDERLGGAQVGRGPEIEAGFFDGGDDGLRSHDRGRGWFGSAQICSRRLPRRLLVRLQRWQRRSRLSRRHDLVEALLLLLQVLAQRLHLVELKEDG